MLVDNYEFAMIEQPWSKKGIQYLTDDLDKGNHALNAFFTCYVDYEHSGTDFNLTLLMKDNHKSDLLAASYFGTSTNGEVMLHGVQTKNIYKLVKFISDNDLWPTITKRKRRLRFWQSKIKTDKRFSDVVNALDDLKDPELTECLRSYPLFNFAIAYSAVGLMGHKRIMSLQAAEVGRIAYRDIKKRFDKQTGGFIKKVLRFGAFVSIAYVLYFILASAKLMDLNLM